MYATGIHNLAMKKTQKLDVMETLQNQKKLRRARDYFISLYKHDCGTIVERHLQDERYHSAKTHNCGTIVERYFVDERYLMRMHGQTYTQSDMEEFDRSANESGVTSLLPQHGLTTETITRSYNPTKEEAPTPQRPKNTLNTNKLSSATNKSSEPDAEQLSSWSSWTWSPHQGPHGGIPRRHKHCDNHNDLPHPMSRQSS